MIVFAALLCGMNTAQAAPMLQGENIYLRLDSQGGYMTRAVGNGAEFTGASPVGRPWDWTVDFGADGSFLITATLTSQASFFNPFIQFASETAGLIPADVGALTIDSAQATLNGAFSYSATSFGAADGLSFGFQSPPDVCPTQCAAGSTVTWSGRIALADNRQSVPEPATLALLGLGLAGLALTRRRAKAN